MNSVNYFVIDGLIDIPSDNFFTRDSEFMMHVDHFLVIKKNHS